MAKKKREIEVSEDAQSKLFEGAIVDKWLARIEASASAKKTFKELSEKCYAFFRKDHGFMWEQKFLSKHIGSLTPPKFRITINKAFELVAVFGPQLYWENPFRSCRPYEPLEFTAEAFGNPQDEQVQQMFQEAQMEQSWEYARSQTRCALMEKYLNYSQREQPQGLHFHAKMAIIEALVKGRGLLWPESYTFSGSDRKLTGLFFDSVDNLFIDPDSTSPSLDDALWIARKHITPVWQLEERFKLKPGTLVGHGNLETIEKCTTNARPVDRIHRMNGMTHDLIVWYEVFSKCGAGTRNVGGMDSSLHDDFEEVLGNHAYLCIAPTVPWFLNAPPPELSGASDDEVREMFAWPFPSFMDNSWPVAILDFYKDPDSCWPIPPLAPALGELICLNTLVSCFVDQAYDNRKTIIAYAESVQQEVETALQGSQNPALIKINETIHKSVGDFIQFLNRPEMNNDLIKAIDYVSQMFDKRTGLIDRQYGETGTQSRSARDAASKDEKSNIRPDQMAKDVAEFITKGSNLEVLLATWDVVGKSLKPLLGVVGARLWDELIASGDPEEVAREMKATVEASDIRKPNKERDAFNMQNLLGIMTPLFQQYATITGDSEPLNNFLEDLCKSVEQPGWRWRMGKWVPDVSPQMAELQQQGAQEEVRNVQADTELKLAQASEKANSKEAKQMELQFEAAKGQQELQIKREEGQMKLAIEAQKAKLDMAVEQQKAGQEIQLDRAKMGNQMQMEQMKFQQDMRMSRAEGNERANQTRLQGALKLTQQKAMNQEAKNKPKTGKPK